MKNKIFFIFISVGLLLMLNCAVTNITSFCDPIFMGKIYRKLLIFAPFTDIESRTRMESAFKKYASESNYAIECIPSIGIIMPTRSYTDDELDKILSDHKIEGVLLLMMTDAYSTQTYVPSSSTTYGFATFSGNVATYYGSTQQYGGYYISKPRIKFAIYLYDVPSKKIAWISSSLTRGNTFARFRTLADSLAVATINKLIKDGLLHSTIF